MNTKAFIGKYARARPLFLSVLRGKEAALYQAYLPLTRPVLDVGCGDGFFARLTFGEHAIDVGLDTGDSRIGEAQASRAYKKTVIYDGRTIPFADNAFRTIVVNSVLEHVSGLPRVVSEMHRVLSPKGVCYATVMAKPWEDHLFGAKLFGDTYKRWMRKKQVHVNLLTETAWRRAFEKAGFTVVSVHPYGSIRAASLLDILHYVSLPSLISHAFTHRWVPWPAHTSWYPHDLFARIMDESVGVRDAAVLFYVLRKRA